MNRRQRKFVRDMAMDYSRRYLGVKRLPAGVPALVKEYVAGLEEVPHDMALASLLRRYRRPLLIL